MLRDWLASLKDRRLIGAGLVASVLMGLSGPFGTYDAEGFAARTLFWALVIGLSLPIAVVIRLEVDRRLGRLVYWTRALLVCTAFTAAYAPLLMGILRLRMDPDHAQWLTLPEIALIVFAVALLINVLDWVADLGIAASLSAPPAAPADRPGQPRPTPARTPPVLPEPPVPAPAPEVTAPPLPGPAAPERPAPPPEPPLPRLVARLPEALRAPVRSVSVRDHYVDVRTAHGEAGLLLRLSDAIGELDGVDGAQVHRSHWVARAAVAGVERRQGRVFLRLVDGRSLPVSRSRQSALAARGWL